MASLAKELRDFMGNVIQWPVDLLGGGWGGLAPSASGVVVTEFTALQISAFVSCVRIISDQVASLPLKIHQRQADGTEVEAWDHPLAHLLHSQPNPEVNAASFRQAGQGHALVNGNCYAEIVLNNGGDPAAMYLRSPYRTYPYRTRDGKLVYQTADTPSGQIREIKAEAMVHIPGMGFDGIVGLSPVKFYMRELLGGDLAAQNFSNTFWANDSRPGGYLKFSTILKPAQKLEAVQSWIAGHTRSQANRPAVLDGGVTWEKVGVDPQEAQFLETRKFNRTQIAAIFGVPPHLIGEATSDSRATLEQRNVEFLIYCVKPWLKKWEQALTLKLFPPLANGRPSQYFCKFDTTELERPTYDLLTKGLQMARYAGGITMNEMRKALKLPPVAEEDFQSTNPADRFWMPVNMVNVTDDEQPTKSAVAGSDANPDSGDDTEGGIKGDEETPGTIDLSSKLGKAFAPSFRDAFGRMRARTAPTEKDFQKVFGPVMFGIAATLGTDDDGLLPEEAAGIVREHIADLARRWGALDADEELAHAIRQIAKATKKEPVQ
jgi:HK97 family phage portal protein